MANHDGEMFKSKITVYVLACWILASFGGLMFGYDIGISGMLIMHSRTFHNIECINTRYKISTKK